MSDNEEVTAAATGAAAAVAAVQDQEAQEEATGAAVGAAIVATDAAQEAASEAQGAAQTATVAVEAATDAQERAADAEIGLAQVHERISAVENKTDEFIGEARGFFSRLESRFAEPETNDDVQKVEVTNATREGTDASANQTTDIRGNAGSAGSASGTGNSTRARKSFGRR